MKNMHKIAGLFLFMLSINLFYSCKKDKEPTSVSDIDGNVYKIVTIGSQTWMAENLKTTKLYDGMSIPNKTIVSFWPNFTTFAYCWYDNDTIVNKNVYGALYNWYTVLTGKLCPQGWHIPSEEEWTTLSTYLGGLNSAGGKLKEIGTTHWNSPNSDATNETGFTALPGGLIYNGGSFTQIGYEAIWWSSTESVNSTAWYWQVNNDFNLQNGKYPEEGGFSIRCIKN
jgi:uncharacterized protein (TIGR02145 family)